MRIVVDASVALAWALPDESNEYADAVLAEAETAGILVPELWAREVANGLAIGHARRRISIAQQEEFIGGLAQLDIVVAASKALDIMRDGTRTAREYGLTAYDAAYVALAKRENLQLATLDNRMRDAATRISVRVF